jgi:hypothetical protein
MAALWRFLGLSPTRTQPNPVATDDIYPVHMLDGNKTLRTIVIAWTLCFNDVLDPDKLYTSLSKLLEIGDWRKIGGRLRLKVRSFLIFDHLQSLTSSISMTLYSVDNC